MSRDPLRNVGVGNPRRLRRSSPAAAAAGDVVLIAESSPETSRLRFSSTETSVIVRSFANGSARRFSSDAPMPVSSKALDDDGLADVERFKNADLDEPVAQ